MLPHVQQRSRPGCGLGCLTRTLLVCVIAGAAVLGGKWIFTPWAFYLGGTFHPFGTWQGTARVQTSAGEYVLTISLTSSGISRLSGSPDFSGRGDLCTPTGERFPLTVYGLIPERSGRDTNGKPMRIDVHRRPWNAFFGDWDHRPQLTMRGRWQNPDLVMNDGGTFSRQFLPDGRLYDGPPSRQPAARETVPVVFHESPWSFQAPACAPAR
jgi:hypothetical protein